MATATLKILGITDERTNCECCGRADLKATVLLGVCDEDGNVESTTYFGRTCAAKAMGVPARKVDSALNAIAKDAREKAARDHIRQQNAKAAAYDNWLLATYGDLSSNLDRVRRYRAEAGRDA